jgi:hypothetical protein
MTCRSFLVVAGLAFSTSVACAQWVQIDFDSVPTGLHSIPVDSFAGSGLSALRLYNVDPGYPNDELSGTDTPAGLPSPAAGRGIAPLATLLGHLHPFELTFSTPIDAFSLHAFYAHPDVSIFGYHQNTLVAQLHYAAEPGRIHLHMQLGGAGGAHMDRILIGVSPGVPALDPNAGPSYFDQLSFHIIPAPPTALALLCGAAFCRRRRG